MLPPSSPRLPTWCSFLGLSAGPDTGVSLLPPPLLPVPVKISSGGEAGGRPEVGTPWKNKGGNCCKRKKPSKGQGKMNTDVDTKKGTEVKEEEEDEEEKKQ